SFLNFWLIPFVVSSLSNPLSFSSLRICFILIDCYQTGLAGMNEEKPDQKMLDRAKRLQAIAQNGLTYAKDQYDVERFEQVQAIAAEIMADRTPQSVEEIVDIFSDQVGYATPKVDVRGVVFR